MSSRRLASVVAQAAVIGILVTASFRLSAQTQPAPTASTPQAAAWNQPKTPDGQPDLQGVWVNYDRTPFERTGRRPRNENDDDPVNGAAQTIVGSYDRPWTMLTRPQEEARPSMVVDPPDGIVPLKASAEQRRDYDAVRMGDSWAHQSGWERCITRGVPGGMFPAAYNAAYQIVQGPGYVAIIYEMIHEARIIPIDGSPHLPSTVRHWNGDSRGRWEGNTLVVDVTNYNDKANIATSAASGRIRGVHQSASAHVVERFTRVSADRIDYQVTVDDPEIYSKPWTVAMPLTRDPEYRIYEYACHEGNQAMVTILRGANADEVGDVQPPDAIGGQCDRCLSAGVDLARRPATEHGN
jgi:hypothetical protein